MKIFPKSCASVKSIFKSEILFLTNIVSMFCICGCSTQILNKFASEAVLPSSIGNSEIGMITGSFLSDSERGKETENRSILLEGTAVLVVPWGFLLIHGCLNSEMDERFLSSEPA